MGWRSPLPARHWLAVSSLCLDVIGADLTSSCRPHQPRPAVQPPPSPAWVTPPGPTSLLVPSASGPAPHPVWQTPPHHVPVLSLRAPGLLPVTLCVQRTLWAHTCPHRRGPCWWATAKDFSSYSVPLAPRKRQGRRLAAGQSLPCSRTRHVPFTSLNKSQSLCALAARGDRDLDGCMAVVREGAGQP